MCECEHLEPCSLLHVFPLRVKHHPFSVSDMWVHQQPPGDGGPAPRGGQPRNFLWARTRHHPGPPGESGGPVQPGAGQDHQAKSVSRSLSFLCYLLFLILLHFIPVFPFSPGHDHVHSGRRWVPNLPIHQQILWLCSNLYLNSEFSLSCCTANRNALKGGIFKCESGFSFFLKSEQIAGLYCKKNKKN